MFYQLAKLTRRVMTWLKPPQGVEMPPLPPVELMEFTNARGQVEVRLVERDGNRITITKVEG